MVGTKEGIERVYETSVKRRLQISITRSSLIALRGILPYIETLALAVTFSDNGPPILRTPVSPSFLLDAGNAFTRATLSNFSDWQYAFLCALLDALDVSIRNFYTCFSPAEVYCWFS